MAISNLNSIYETRTYGNISALKNRKTEEKENAPSVSAMTADKATGQKTDSVEISAEGLLAITSEKKISDSGLEEQEAREDAGSDVSEETAAADSTAENSDGSSGKVAVNEGKRARQIAAAKDQAQIQQVLALLRKDLSDCKAGREKGWCDDSEIAKVEALISRAQARISEVPRKSDESRGGLDAFAMASLM